MRATADEPEHTMGILTILGLSENHIINHYNRIGSYYYRIIGHRNAFWHSLFIGKPFLVRNGFLSGYVLSYFLCGKSIRIALVNAFYDMNFVWYVKSAEKLTTAWGVAG
jgi:hypothetical protein